MSIKKSGPTVWHEQGIIIDDLHPEMQDGFHAIKKLYYHKKRDLFVTSGKEGDHLMYSFHYDGKAIDILKNGVSRAQVQKGLGSRFQVIDYNWGFHIELDPK